jgi:hypothetical protein
MASDKYFFLRVGHTVDISEDFDEISFIFHHIDIDIGTVRHFLIGGEKYFFTNDFTRTSVDILVGDIIFWVEERSFW